MKDWNDIKSHDSWEIFKIMGEFVEGFERLSRIGPCVSIFGSARTDPNNQYYKRVVSCEHVSHLKPPRFHGIRLKVYM